MTALPERGDALALARTLVAIDSRNPALVAEGPGEARCAHALADVLSAWGFRVDLHECAPGRPNVVARIGRPGGRSLLFNGHLDTVGVDGMIHPPWDPAVRDGRLYGRGSTDMKAGVAAMCAAAVRAADGWPGGPPGELIVAAVADEEFESAGTRALIASGLRADAAIVTEPTRLAICPAHRGFAWLELVVNGRAAHGSRWDIGVDANTLASMIVVELDRYQDEVLATKSHPLLGRPSLHAAIIHGGSGISTYADRCSVQFERRTIPGETAADFTGEVEAAVARVRTRRPHVSVDVKPGFAQSPNDVAADHPIVRALADALGRSAQPVVVEGLSCWTDAALFSEAGIPAVCFGPGDIALAHSTEEYVDVSEVERATRVLATVARSWIGEQG